MATQVTNYQCPACTGPLHYVGESGMLECDYCGSKYTAAEITKVTGYVTGYSSDTFTVYNTLESLKPKTGDDSNLTLWTMLGLSALLCAGGVGILMYKKSRNAG